MQNVLAALKDIPGVIGSFVLNDRGMLVSREMPAIYNDDIYPEMGRRITGVYEAIAIQLASLGDLLLKFEGSWLLCRRTNQCFLGVLTSDNVNYPALKMATNVALKQLDDQVSRMPAISEVKTATVEAPAPPVVPVAAAPAARRMWRGRVVD